MVLLCCATGRTPSRKRRYVADHGHSPSFAAEATLAWANVQPKSRAGEGPDSGPSHEVARGALQHVDCGGRPWQAPTSASTWTLKSRIWARFRFSGSEWGQGAELAGPSPIRCASGPTIGFASRSLFPSPRETTSWCSIALCSLRLCMSAAQHSKTA